MGTIKKLKSKLPAKGSVLVFTLIVLFIILAAAIGISSVSVLERKGAGSTSVSVQSFQIANSGAEIILKKIADNSSSTLNDLGDPGDCTDGKLTGFISSGKNYEITFYTSDGLPITDCGITASNVDKIKSVGSYANTARAIEVAVAATVSGITGGCAYNASAGLNKIYSVWGNGCEAEGTTISAIGSGLGNVADYCKPSAKSGYSCGTVGLVDVAGLFFCECVAN